MFSLHPQLKIRGCTPWGGGCTSNTLLPALANSAAQSSNIPEVSHKKVKLIAEQIITGVAYQFKSHGCTFWQLKKFANNKQTDWNHQSEDRSVGHVPQGPANHICSISEERFQEINSVNRLSGHCSADMQVRWSSNLVWCQIHQGLWKVLESMKKMRCIAFPLER